MVVNDIFFVITSVSLDHKRDEMLLSPRNSTTTELERSEPYRRRPSNNERKGNVLNFI